MHGDFRWSSIDIILSPYSNLLFFTIFWWVVRKLETPVVPSWVPESFFLHLLFCAGSSSCFPRLVTGSATCMTPCQNLLVNLSQLLITRRQCGGWRWIFHTSCIGNRPFRSKVDWLRRSFVSSSKLQLRGITVVFRISVSLKYQLWKWKQGSAPTI